MTEESSAEFETRWREDRAKNREKIAWMIEHFGFSEDDVLNLLADSLHALEEYQKIVDEQCALLRDYEMALKGASANFQNASYEINIKLLEMRAEAGGIAAKALLKGVQLQKASLAKKGANALHSQSGGSRERQEKIRAAWASGKYSSRDVCAEQECAALGMSFSSARKALRGTSDPT